MLWGGLLGWLKNGCCCLLLPCLLLPFPAIFRPTDGVISWNQLTQEGLPTGTEAVIQLAGQSILKLPRWTEAHKEEVCLECRASSW